MHIIKKSDFVVFQQEHIDPQTGGSYYIENRYSIRQYNEIKEIIRNEILGEINAKNNILSDV